jgi:hypothetical protein
MSARSRPTGSGAGDNGASAPLLVVRHRSISRASGDRHRVRERIAAGHVDAQQRGEPPGGTHHADLTGPAGHRDLGDLAVLLQVVQRQAGTQPQPDPLTGRGGGFIRTPVVRISRCGTPITPWNTQWRW